MSSTSIIAKITEIYDKNIEFDTVNFHFSIDFIC